MRFLFILPLLLAIVYGKHRIELARNYTTAGRCATWYPNSVYIQGEINIPLGGEVFRGIVLQPTSPTTITDMHFKLIMNVTSVPVSIVGNVLLLITEDDQTPRGTDFLQQLCPRLPVDYTVRYDQPLYKRQQDVIYSEPFMINTGNANQPVRFDYCLSSDLYRQTVQLYPSSRIMFIVMYQYCDYYFSEQQGLTFVGSFGYTSAFP